MESRKRIGLGKVRRDKSSRKVVENHVRRENRVRSRPTRFRKIIVLTIGSMYIPRKVLEHSSRAASKKRLEDLKRKRRRSLI